MVCCGALGQVFLRIIESFVDAMNADVLSSPRPCQPSVSSASCALLLSSKVFIMAATGETEE